MQKFSLLLNLLLVVCLIAVVTARRKGAQVALLRAQPLKETAVDQKQTRILTVATGEAQPFRWCQIESPDYRVYVANLRRIGCPEQTVRDIISADVGSLYALKRKELQIDDQSAAGPWSRSEEKRLVTMLLGKQAVTSVSGQRPSVAPTPVLPLVLQRVDLVALGLDNSQKAAIDEVRSQFITDIGGLEQDPAEPAYANRWRKAQPQSDALLRGLIGVSAFMRYQLQVEH